MQKIKKRIMILLPVFLLVFLTGCSKLESVIISVMTVMGKL